VCWLAVCWLAVCWLAVCWHTRHTALVLRGQRPGAARQRGPAPWCCAASAALRPSAARPARPCALVLRGSAPKAGVAGPSG